MCTENDNHMIYGSWDTKCNRQIFLSFWTIFCPFTPLTTWKMKILKKWKKTHGDNIILHKGTINDNHLMYGSWDMERDRHEFLSFWTVFFPFSSLTTQKIKILKHWKNAWRYHHFTQVDQKSWPYAILFLRYGT